jgi:hypothetical protein
MFLEHEKAALAQKFGFVLSKRADVQEPGVELFASSGD